MTSSHKLPKWNLSRFWNSEFLFPVLLCFFLAVFGAFLGLTDDEAYYWVLAQKPALGYAYHPPMVAWMIALTQKLSFLGIEGAASVRLSAAISMAAVFGMGLHWIKDVRNDQSLKHSWLISASTLAFGAFFGLAWMMVPDVPLFLGWSLSFWATWRICKREKVTTFDFSLLGLGVAIGLLSKFSSVLWIFSSGLCLLFFAPKTPDKNRKWKAIFAVIVGALVALVPILIWNAQHEWGALLYQFRDRHEEAHVSFLRYARFWGSQLALVGPPLVVFFFLCFKDLLKKVRGLTPNRYALIWALPSAFVFMLQPLWSDFKPHWTLIAWWPIFLLMVLKGSAQKPRSATAVLFQSQLIYSFALILFLWIGCYFPVLGSLSSSVARNPLLDVTNDMYGWSSLKGNLVSQFGASVLQTPFVASRYQTAAQASFALRPTTPVTLLPRETKSRDEWPNLPVADHWGPHWPKLNQAVFFISDNRYSAAPEFPGAKCFQAAEFDTYRYSLLAKQIRVWRCEPGA